MARLSDEQIQKLTKEQQEILAAVELRLAQKRQGLIEAAQVYRGFFIAPSICVLICFLLLVFSPEKQKSLQLCFFVLFALVQFHVSSINRRLNALFELLEPNIKSASEPKQKSDNP